MTQTTPRHTPETEPRTPTPTTPTTAPGRASGNTRNIADVARELGLEVGDLLRQEMALARTEMREKAGTVVRNLASLAAGGLVAYLGIAFVLAAGSMLLTSALVSADVDPTTASWIATLAVGVLVLVIGWALVQKAISTLRRARLYPDKTIDSLKENARWIKGKSKTT